MIGQCAACGRDRVAIKASDMMCPLCWRLHFSNISDSDLALLARHLFVLATEKQKEITGRRHYGPGDKTNWRWWRNRGK
jgi:hypothetical protein